MLQLDEYERRNLGSNVRQVTIARLGSTFGYWQLISWDFIVIVRVGAPLFLVNFHLVSFM